MQLRRISKDERGERISYTSAGVTRVVTRAQAAWVEAAADALDVMWARARVAAARGPDWTPPARARADGPPPWHDR